VADVVFHAHSGLRYLVLVAALVALVLLVRGRMTGTQYGGAARTAGAVFVGLLDLQLLIGLLLLVLLPYYPALIGHIIMMVLAVAIAHGARVAARKAGTEAKRYTWATASIVVPFLLIVGGIMAIGRPLL
jgi:hypothetical protein